LWLGRQAHVVHYPIAQGAAINVVAVVEEKWDKPGWSAIGEPAELVTRFENWPAAARKLLAGPVNWQKYAIAEVDPNGTWAQERMALLGDAAHAMSPFLAQGAAMAIEDAAVLSDSMRGAADIPAALVRYETARKPRTVRMAEASRQAGEQYHDAGLMALGRDLALRFAGERLILDRNDWIYRWVREGDVPHFISTAPDEGPQQVPTQT
jgi:salicylate hydroxylase